MGMATIPGNIKYVFTQITAPTGEGEVEGSLWYNTTDNKLYTYTGSSWEKVAEAGEWKASITETIGTAVQVVDFTGLDIEDDGTYILALTLLNSNGGAINYSMSINADYTATNYHNQYILGNAGGVSSARTNTNHIETGIGNGSYHTYLITITKVAGSVTSAIIQNRGGDSATTLTAYYRVWNTTSTTNLTSIRIASDGADGIGVSSRLCLYKMEK